MAELTDRIIKAVHELDAAREAVARLKSNRDAAVKREAEARARLDEAIHYWPDAPPDKVSKATETLRVRLAPEHKQLIHDAADRAGIVMTSWVKSRLIRIAREELG